MLITNVSGCHKIEEIEEYRRENRQREALTGKTKYLEYWRLSFCF